MQVAEYEYRARPPERFPTCSRRHLKKAKQFQTAVISRMLVECTFACSRTNLLQFLSRKLERVVYIISFAGDQNLPAWLEERI